MKLKFLIVLTVLYSCWRRDHCFDAQVKGTYIRMCAYVALHSIKYSVDLRIQINIQCISGGIQVCRLLGVLFVSLF